MNCMVLTINQQTNNKPLEDFEKYIIHKKTTSILAIFLFENILKPSFTKSKLQIKNICALNPFQTLGLSKLSVTLINLNLLQIVLRKRKETTSVSEKVLFLRHKIRSSLKHD